MNTHQFFHDEKERRRWYNPETVLVNIGLKIGNTLIDIGCGDGFFTLPAAKIVGSEGKIFGIDSDRDALNLLKRKSQLEGFNNIRLRLAKAEDDILCEECTDLVFFSIVLHDFKDPQKVLVNAKKMLKSTGKLINIDWKKEQMEYGPPLQIRFTEEDAMHLIESAGFTIEDVQKVEPYHYMIIAKP